MFANSVRAVAVLCVVAGFAPARADEPKPMRPPVPVPLPNADPSRAAAERTFSIHFKAVAWDDAFAWYAKESGLKADVTVEPKGTFTFTPPKERRFTLGEFTDILNETLAQQKLYLYRSYKSFVVVSIEKMDPKRIPAIELKDLPTRGRTELVEVAIPINYFDATDAGDELKKLLTPFGELLYAKGKWIVVRDTAGNVVRIIKTLEACAKAADEPKTFTFRFKDAPWGDVFDAYAKLSGLTLITTVKPKGTFTFTPPKPDTRYTLAEITDIINDGLASQKFILTRRHMTFFIHDATEKLEPRDLAGLFPRIALDDLDKFGRTELVQVILPVADDVLDQLDELKKLPTPFGSISRYKNTFIVSDTAENVRRIKTSVEPWPKK